MCEGPERDSGNPEEPVVGPVGASGALRGTAYSFPRAAVSHYHRRGGFKQQKFTLS